MLEKRTGLPCFPMPLTVGKTHRLPPEQLHFTQGIPAPLPRRDRVPVGKPHRIGPFPVLQFTQVWLFLAYLQLYAGCFPHRKMVVEVSREMGENGKKLVLPFHQVTEP